MTQQEFELEWHNDENFVRCHTSGSTGKPKNIRLTKDFMRESAVRTVSFFGLDSTSRLHTCLDFQYIASKMMTVRADVAGCRLTSEPPSSSPLRAIAPDERIDLLSLVPSQMGSLLDEKEFRPGLRNLLIGGSAIPPLLRRRIALSSYTAWESYGMTETASHIALRQVEETGNVPFKTLPGITVKLNADGCLVVNLPAKRPLKTTDIAEVLSPTEFRILGRADNAIITGGIKVIPENLEALIGPFIAFDYALTSLPDEKWGERLVMAVEVPDPQSHEDFLKKAIELRLAMFRKALALGPKAPKEVVILTSLPRTSNGKISRVALKAQLAKTISAGCRDI